MRLARSLGFGLLTLPLLLSAGCGSTGPGASTVAPPKFGPNEGPLVTLPGGGFAEVFSEVEGETARLAVSFYGSEQLNTPLAPAPTDVKVELAQPGGGTVPVALAPASGGTGTKFASSPGDYVLEPLIGTLNATVGGQAVSEKFSGRLN